MSKGESGHLHTAKNCRKFISGTLGKKKKKQTKLWTGFFSKWSFKLLFLQPKMSAASPKPPSPSKKPILLLVLHTFPWNRWYRQFLKQFTYEFPSADSINIYLTKTLAWNKLVWTVYRLNPVLGKVVVANREKWTTATKVIKWPVRPSQFLQEDSKSLPVETWLITFIYAVIAKQHWNIIVRPTILKVTLLLRSDASTFTFSQAYKHTRPHSHLLLILTMKSPCFKVLSQYTL